MNRNPWARVTGIIALLALLFGSGLVPRTDNVAAGAPITLSGIFSAIYGDPPPDSGLPPQVRYSLSNESGTWNLSISDSVLNAGGGVLALNRKTVTVKGEETSPGNIAVQSISLAAAAFGQPSPPLAVSGSQRFRTLLCKFADVAAEPQPLSFFDTVLGSTKPGAKDYWGEVSYGNINLDGSTQHNWLTLPKNRNLYFVDDDPTKDIQLGELATDCATVHDPTVDFSGVEGINFVFNASIGCCAWGGGNYAGPHDGTSNFRPTWMPPAYWGSVATGFGVWGQEMGHAFDMPHEGCQGTTSPYDSLWDVMSAARQVHINADYKDRIEGWIGAGRKYTATGASN